MLLSKQAAPIYSAPWRWDSADESGNLDIRDMAQGTELYLLVEVAGGLCSLGDTHAAQGDGEVCGTAIESPCTVAAKLELVKGANFAFPRVVFE